MGIELIKSNENGKTYQADGFKIIYKFKGKVGGDNKKNPHEFMYLVSGKAEVTIENNTVTYEAPSNFEIPAKTYHKILALTDITLILFED